MSKVSVGSVAFINNSNFNTSKNGDVINYLDTGSITDNIISEVQTLEVGKDNIPSRAKRKIDKNTIVYSGVRPRLKHFGIIRNPLDNMVGSTGFITLDADLNKVDSDYLYYCISQSKYIEYLAQIADTNASSYPSINPSDLANMQIDIIDDLNEQIKIGVLLRNIDLKIALNNKINQDLEILSKTLYDYWFLQFEFPNEDGKPYKSTGGKMVWNEELKREIPEGWNSSTVTKCIKHVNTGLNPRNNFKLGNGNIKYVTVKNLTTNGSIDFAGCDTINEGARSIVHNRSDVSKNDILFASIAPLGRCVIVQENPKDWDINESVFSIRPNLEKVSSEYLYLYFMSEHFIKKAEHSSSGSVFNGIRINVLEDIPILIPENKIMIKFTESVKKMLYMKYVNEKENQELAFLRDFLLPLLMNGQVGFKED